MRKTFPLPLASPGPTGPLVSCTECGRCCTYVGVGINAPTRPRYATDILWYLYHENISVYRDGDGEWQVLFETRCRNLEETLLCRIYPERPHICRAFDNQTCDVNSTDDRARTFRTAPEFLAWLKADRPRVYRRIEDKYVPRALREDEAPAPRKTGKKPVAASRGK